MKEVLVCMHSSGSAQRRFLAGVSDFVHTHVNWSIRFDPRPERLTPDVFHCAVKSGIRGAIVCDDGIPHLGQIIGAAPVPIVVFGSMRPEFAATARPVGFVMSDDVGIGELAAEHLLSLGNFRSFGYVPDQDGTGWSVNRSKGFGQRLKEEHRRMECFRCRGSAYDRRIRLQKWLVALPKPAAIMAACDHLGAEVLELCQLARIEVPKAVAVIGVDNDTLVDEMSEPALTSIAADHEEEGRLAAALLTRLMRRHTASRPIVARCDKKNVVIRGSTQYVTSSAYIVSRAIDYIESNAAADIKIEDLARHLGISRRLLDRRFREFSDETVNNTILRFRLAEVRRRLLSSSLPISRIAENCGFPNPAYLKKLFLARYGEPMESFRR